MSEFEIIMFLIGLVHANAGSIYNKYRIKNILNFIPKDPLLRPFDPFNKNIAVNNPNNYSFDTTYNYAPIQGIRGFLGIRWLIN